MKNLFLSLILTVISFSVFAQDTIYMDNNYQELDKKENAKYFKIVTPTPDKDYEFLEPPISWMEQKKLSNLMI